MFGLAWAQQQWQRRWFDELVASGVAANFAAIIVTTRWSFIDG